MIVSHRQPLFSKVLTLPQLAKEMRVSQVWLREQAREGTIPSLPAGRNNFVFNVAAVEAALAELAAPSEGEG